MMLCGKILRDLFEHERLKCTIIRTSKGNGYNLQQLKQVVNIGVILKLEKTLITTIICRDRYVKTLCPLPWVH